MKLRQACAAGNHAPWRPRMARIATWKRPRMALAPRGSARRAAPVMSSVAPGTRGSGAHPGQAERPALLLGELWVEGNANHGLTRLRALAGVDDPCVCEQ